MSTGTTETQVFRRKQHKGGKILSLSILWTGGGIVAFLVVVGIIAAVSGGHAKQYNRDDVAVTSTEKTLQPVSPKIVASDSESLITATEVDSTDYADIWRKLERLAPANAKQSERLKAITSFLDGLDFRYTAPGGEIVSKSTGNPVAPSTLSCYLNGYIPEKPYLKANCPAY